MRQARCWSRMRGCRPTSWMIRIILNFLHDLAVVHYNTTISKGMRYFGSCRLFCIHRSWGVLQKPRLRAAGPYVAPNRLLSVCICPKRAGPLLTSKQLPSSLYGRPPQPPPPLPPQKRNMYIYIYIYMIERPLGIICRVYFFV